MDRVNLIVATTNNKGVINLSIKSAARELVSGHEVSEGLLNTVEMFYRAYDPCMACASHALPGVPALEIKVYDARGNVIKTMRNV
jgi:F420-non-reducing hydrogenase large subunit